MDLEREQILIRAFFLPSAQERWLAMVRKPLRRAKALDALNHLAELDGRYGAEFASLPEARRRLVQLGAPRDCYVMSDIAAIDGRVMALDEALVAAEQGGWGTLLDCLPGELAFYLGERSERRLVLSRRSG